MLTSPPTTTTLRLTTVRQNPFAGFSVMSARPRGGPKRATGESKMRPRGTKAEVARITRKIKVLDSVAWEGRKGYGPGLTEEEKARRVELHRRRQVLWDRA